MIELHLTKKDFHVDWFSGQGAGGQYRNKHQNCCRITHIATGLRSTGQSNRDRPSNQREAFKSLVGKIIAFYDNGVDPRRILNNVVRTYHFERNVATNQSIELPVQRVMDGEIDQFIEYSLKHGVPIRETGRMK